MKQLIKCSIAAVVVVAAGFAAYQSYGPYGAQNNNLLMQNIEALAQDMEPDGEDGSECRKFDPIKCYIYPATQGVQSLICPEGTGRYVYAYCPTELGKCEPFTATGFCLREISN